MNNKITLSVKTTKDEWLSHYIQIMNSFIGLSDRERQIITSMVRHGDNGFCDRTTMKKVREELDINQAYISPMLKRMKDKGAINKVSGGWSVVGALVPPKTKAKEVSFVFNFEDEWNGHL